MRRIRIFGRYSKNLSTQLMHLLYSCVSMITFFHFKSNTWKILSSHYSTYSPFKNAWNISVPHRKSSLALSNRSFWYARCDVPLLCRKGNSPLLCSKWPLTKTCFYFHLMAFCLDCFQKKTHLLSIKVLGFVFVLKVVGGVFWFNVFFPSH